MLRLRLSKPRSFASWILAALALAVPATPALAGVGVWTPLGPDGAAVTALAVDPTDPDVVYAGTRGSGLFKSVDGGAAWAFAGRGLGAPDISALTIDPTDSRTLYAATIDSGLFRSTDGGGSWVKIWDGVPPVSYPSGSIYVLAVDPQRPSTLYAGTNTGFYRSTDRGAAWSRYGSFGMVLGLAMDAAGGWLYAGDYGQGVFRSSDRGKTWTPANGGMPQPRRIFSLAIDPERPKTLLAGTDAWVYRSLDRGKSWQNAPETLRDSFAVVFQRRGRAFAVGANGIFRSTDAGGTWQIMVVPVVSEFYFTSLAAGPTTVHAGGVGPLEEGGDVFRSLDAGIHWERSGGGLHGHRVEPIAVVPSAPRTLFAVVGHLSIYRSGDGGGTWTEVYHVTSGINGITDILLDPARPGRVYATGYGYPSQILRSDDGGDTWEILEGRMPDFEDIAIDPRAPDALWSVGGLGPPGGLFHSADGGATWEWVPTFAGTYIFRHVEVDPRDPRVVYVGGERVIASRPPQFFPLLLRSADGGATWERRDAGLEGSNVWDIALDTTDPGNPATLYAVTSRLYRSTDDGVTWSVPAGARGRSFVSLATSPAIPASPASSGTPAAVYAVRQVPPAVLRSTDRGATWTVLRQGLAPYAPFDVAVDPNDPSQLYLGTLNGGLMSYSLP